MYDICGPTRPPSLKLMIMNEIRWPFRAICLPSSKNGIMWPKANHGNMAMWSFLSSAMEFKWWCSVFFFTLLWLRYVGWTLHNDIRLLLWSFIAWLVEHPDGSTYQQLFVNLLCQVALNDEKFMSWNSSSSNKLLKNYILRTPIQRVN